MIHHRGKFSACSEEVVKKLEYIKSNDTDTTSINKLLVEFFNGVYKICRQKECFSVFIPTLVVLNKHTMEYVCANMGDSQGIHLKDNTYY